MPYGEYPYSVDDKGRVIIPPQFRSFVEDGMVVTRGLERCLYIFPTRRWAALEEKLESLPVTDADARRFTRYFYSGAAKVKIDAAGRITLPGTLRAFAGLENSVMIAGTPNHLEIWDEALWSTTIGDLQENLPAPALLGGMVGVNAPHAPVMLAECLAQLELEPGRWYIDGTFGAGGHTGAILAAGGRVLALDCDPSVQRFLDPAALQDGRLLFAEGNFSELDAHAERLGVAPVAGVLLDLGVSSMQLDEAGRGFSFRQPGPLDMRMGAVGLSAADLVNHAPQEELASLIFRYGEDRYSRRIARRIAEARDHETIETTERLAEVIARAYPPGPRRDHPARRTFQALRIAVNDELGALQGALAALARVLAPEGRAVVLTYHSLEDRIVKHFFKDSAIFTPLHKKPLTAGPDEIARNPRARSAKLRAAALTSPIPQGRPYDPA